MQAKLIKLIVALVTIWALIYPFIQDESPQDAPPLSPQVRDGFK